MGSSVVHNTESHNYYYQRIYYFNHKNDFYIICYYNLVLCIYVCCSQVKIVKEYNI